ncbi:MAG: twin transmembrane helix small protein [Woeseiaceae bacterium]|nr:twin transmembrane helix small protein [Woeseiaceae bacterium]NIP20694.1 twin transmembrane helix small protein [Woeseiaceae bacterium]NIS89487.1 twin transmembrane helix small protein [Woeseiaceae bacterium]
MDLVTLYSIDQTARETTMKIIVLVLLAAIVIALFSGLFFLAKDKDHPPSPRLLTALKVRVSLSILLVVLLVISYQMGWLTGLAEQ